MCNKPEYLELRKVSKELGEHNDCTVVATAIVYGLTYMEAHKILASLGRRAGDGFNMSSVIRKLGRNSPPVYRPKQPNGSLYTVKTITNTLPMGKFLISVDGHVLACIDGEIYDWTENRKHRVIKYIEIDKTELLDLL